MLSLAALKKKISLPVWCNFVRSGHGFDLSAGAGAKSFGSFLQKRTSFLLPLPLLTNVQTAS
jgi:hypothetical protein